MRVPTAVRATLGLVWSPPEQDALQAVVRGKTVLITGASRGIGAAAARRLAGAGAHVILVARTVGDLEKRSAEIMEAGGTAEVYPADLADRAAVSELVAQITAEHGAVDVVVSNAGKSIRRSVDQSYDRFHDVMRTIDVNYLGPVQLLLGLLPAMRARRAGHIVNVSSISADLPAPYFAAYTASKTAFEAWLRSVAPELRADRIATTSIHFPLVHTAMSAPTGIYRHLPGMTATEAADAVCRAIAYRRRLMSPWWSRLGGVVASTAQPANDAVFTAYYRAARRLSGAAPRR